MGESDRTRANCTFLGLNTFSAKLRLAGYVEAEDDDDDDEHDLLINLCDAGLSEIVFGWPSCEL